MVRVTVTEAKAKLLSLIDDVQAGEEIELTRHGKPVARLVPTRSAQSIEGCMKGIVWATDPEDDLYSINAEWDMEK